MEKFKQFAVQKMAKKCNRNEKKVVQEDKKNFICQEKVRFLKTAILPDQFANMQ